MALVIASAKTLCTEQFSRDFNSLNSSGYKSGGLAFSRRINTKLGSVQAPRDADHQIGLLALIAYLPSALSGMGRNHCHCDVRSHMRDGISQVLGMPPASARCQHA
jgi:hypothetical protein